MIDFKLTTRFNPDHLSRKLRKTWLSTCGKYRITWRKQFMLVDVLPRYYALRVNKRDCDGEMFWDFALDSERRPYKTFKKAVQACCKAEGIIVAPPTKRTRLKRKGSTKTTTTPLVPVVPESKKRGRPVKIKVLAQELQKIDVPVVAKKRGRPVGSKNKVTDKILQTKKRKTRAAIRKNNVL